MHASRGEQIRQLAQRLVDLVRSISLTVTASPARRAVEVVVRPLLEEAGRCGEGVPKEVVGRACVGGL